jgi:hypothetical protein
MGGSGACLWPFACMQLACSWHATGVLLSVRLHATGVLLAVRLHTTGLQTNPVPEVHMRFGAGALVATGVLGRGGSGWGRQPPAGTSVLCRFTPFPRAFIVCDLTCGCDRLGILRHTQTGIVYTPLHAPRSLFAIKRQFSTVCLDFSIEIMCARVPSLLWWAVCGPTVKNRGQYTRGHPRPGRQHLFCLQSATDTVKRLFYL